MDSVSALQTYNKISSIVDHVVAVDLELSVAHYFDRFLAWALWEYKELKMDQAQDVQTLLLPVSEALTCDLPPNMVDWVTIGVQDGQYAKVLCHNTKLNKLDRTSVSEFKQFQPGTLPNGTDFSSYGGYEFSNYGGRSLWAVGGGFPSVGHYTVRSKADGCKELLLNNNLGPITEIYLEFIGIGINCCGETVVDPRLSDYVRCAVHHQWAKFQKPPLRSETEILRTGREMWAAGRKVAGRVNKITPDDIIMIARRNYRMTNKI